MVRAPFQVLVTLRLAATLTSTWMIPVLPLMLTPNSTSTSSAAAVACLSLVTMPRELAHQLDSVLPGLARLVLEAARLLDAFACRQRRWRRQARLDHQCRPGW